MRRFHSSSYRSSSNLPLAGSRGARGVSGKRSRAGWKEAGIIGGAVAVVALLIAIDPGGSDPERPTSVAQAPAQATQQR